MIHGNAVFIREEAKLARNTHLYTFSTRNFTSFNSVNFPGVTIGSLSIKQTTPLAAEIICSHDYDVMLGGVAHKCFGTYEELKASRFLNDLPEIKKSSTIKGLKSSS